MNPDSEVRITPPLETPKKESLPSKEMENLISAIGNHENKALTLLAMKAGTIYTIGDIQKTFNESQLDNIGWKVSIRIPFGYCDYSLAPIGLVAKGVLDENLNIWGYIKTQKGEELGVPLAGLLLKFSERHPTHSLSDYFGYTTSPRGKSTIPETDENALDHRVRSPIVRMRIYKFLGSNNTNLPLNEKGIAKEIGIAAGLVGNHLAELSKLGILTYRTVNMSQEHVQYKATFPTHERIPIQFKNGFKSVLQVVKEIFDANSGKNFSRSQIILALRSAYPVSEENENKVLHGVNAALNELEKRGYVERGTFRRETRSEVTLTPNQRTVIIELASMLNAFQNLDPRILEHGRQTSRELMSNPARSSALTLKAREHSANANKTSPDETLSWIYQIVSENPGINTNDIRIKLEDEQGKKIDPSGIHRLLRRLKAEDRLASEGSKYKRWFIKIPLVGTEGLEPPTSSM